MEKFSHVAPIMKWAGVTVGIIGGLLLFLAGIQPIFTLGTNDNLLSFVMILTSSFCLLPLSVLGIWRPRIAAYALWGSTVLYLACCAISTTIQLLHETGLELNEWPFLSFTIPPLLVSTLLFLGSYRAEQPRN